ncbi:MAG TPA: glycogen-binding domain-containing protein [Gemmatimonadaceae bacterium]
MRDERSLDGFTDAGAEPDQFIREIAATLRAEEEPSAGFDRRVMAAVRHESATRAVRANARPWWRQRSISLSPLGALALAASVAAVAYVGAREIESPADRPGSSTTMAAEDGTEIVRFVFVDPNATQVTVVGSFNQWRKDATPLEATGVPGVWAVSVPLEAGRHEYAFVVDGKKWSADPFAPAITDEFGTESSIVRIGQAPTSS